MGNILKKGLILMMMLALAMPLASGLAEDALEGTQTAVIEGFDWGPSVTKTILSLGKEIDPASVTKDSFAVKESKQGMDWSTFTVGILENERVILDAYTSDEKGNKTEAASAYVTIEMAVDPNMGSPYFYDMMGTGQNRFADPYDMEITLNGSLTAADGSSVTALAIAPVDITKALVPQLEKVAMDGKFTGLDGKTLTFASYEPADSEKHPLVIWLHGAGEGGVDPSVALLGNKVTALVGDAFQSVLGGAYVLTPQTESFWLVWDEADPSTWGDNPGTRSIYNDVVMELIRDYIAKHPGVDESRVYVGGCSNGGYFTMALVLENPDFFAAAFPICEAYLDEGITDEQLTAIKDVPLWFVYSRDDTTVDPTKYEEPTIARLRAIGADVHTSVFDHVVDTSGLYKDAEGNPYTYMGHWSWLYFFNGQCEENGVNMWQWMAQQHK